MRRNAGSQEEAIILEARLRADLLVGKPIAEGSPARAVTTLGQLRQRVVDRVWAGTKGEATATMNAASVVSFFGEDYPLSGVSTAAIDGYVAHLEGLRNSNGTVNRKLAALSKMLRFAHQRGWIDGIPHIPRKREGPGRHRQVTEDEQEKIVIACRLLGRHDELDLFAFLVDTGLRLGEALKLEWRHVMPAGASVVVEDSKNGGQRLVPLTKRAKAVLERRRHRPAPFQMEKRHAQRVWSQVRDRMGLAGDTGFVIHSLRHTFASRLVQRGVPLQVVGNLCGHKSLQVTMRYAYLAPANLEEAIQVLE